MDKTAGRLGGLVRSWLGILKRHSVVIIISVLLSWVYMGSTLTSCNINLVGGIGGDHISGIIWLFQNTPHPYGGISSITNFPFNENVAQPQLITSALHMVPGWLVSKVVGPMCAWNLMVFAGYMLSALTMYGFIYWLLRSRSIATFAAIAVGFTPYHYWKTWGHLSYTQSELFVAILWAYLAFWRRPTKLKALLLGILSSGLLYADGYFPLIGGVLLGSLTLYGLASGYLSARQKRAERALFAQRIRYLCLAVGVFFIALLPIVFVEQHYHSRIAATFAHSRGDQALELETYGARPADFVVPSQTAELPLARALAQDYRANHIYSNTGEYHLFLGYSVIGLSLVAIGFALHRRLNKARKAAADETWVIWVLGAVLTTAVIGIIVSFAPSVTVLGVQPPWPSSIISHFLKIWRVFARLYLVINVAVVTAAAIGLWFVLRKIDSRRVRNALVGVVIVICILEMMPINPFNRPDVWSLKDASATYWWLRDQKQIPAIAAYPIAESPEGTTYFGDQVVHRKKLLNSYGASDPELLLHRALAGPEDTQTLGVLKKLGINDLLIYADNLPVGDNRLNLSYKSPGAIVAHIKPEVPALNHVLVADINYLKPVVSLSGVSCRQQTSLSASLNVRRLNNDGAHVLNVSFDIKGNPGQTIIVHKNGEVLDNFSFTGKDQVHPLTIAVSDSEVISIGQLLPPSSNPIYICNLGVNN